MNAKSFKVTLACPWPIRSEIALWILAHETKHLLQFSEENMFESLHKPCWVLEFEAEMFALKFFTTNSIRLPYNTVRKAKNYVSTFIHDDVPRFMKMNVNIPPPESVHIPNKERILDWIYSTSTDSSTDLEILDLLYSDEQLKIL